MTSQMPLWAEMDRTNLIAQSPQVTNAVDPTRIPPNLFHEHTYGHEVVAFHELPADDDTIVLMSFGMHLPETPTNPAASSLHHAARQGDELPEDLTSDTESNSSEDLARHETQVFTVSLPARIVQLNQINPNLRKQQIARACNWPLQQVYADYFVLHRPRDLEDRMLHVRLIQRQGELPTDSDLQLLLVDIEYHPVPPSWEIDRSRYPRYFPPSMTSRQLLEQLEIARYCDHVILPCLVWLDTTEEFVRCCLTAIATWPVYSSCSTSERWSSTSHHSICSNGYAARHESTGMHHRLFSADGRRCYWFNVLATGLSCTHTWWQVTTRSTHPQWQPPHPRCRWSPFE